MKRSYKAKITVTPASDPIQLLFSSWVHARDWGLGPQLQHSHVTPKPAALAVGNNARLSDKRSYSTQRFTKKAVPLVRFTTVRRRGGRTGPGRVGTEFKTFRLGCTGSSLATSRPASAVRQETTGMQHGTVTAALALVWTCLRHQPGMTTDIVTAGKER